jgi:Ser/Thr protein kinase RdoA (MazF antagonist)
MNLTYATKERFRSPVIEPQDDDAIAWAQETLRQQSGDDLRLDDVRRVTSRLAALHQLTAVSSAGVQTFYLKRYPPGEFETRPDRLSHLAAAAAAVDAVPGLLSFRTVAIDLPRGLLLTAAVPGRPLATLHRSAIFSKATRDTASETWRGVGRWLNRLHRHSVPPVVSGSRAAELLQETRARLDVWRSQDPARAHVAESAQVGLAVLDGQLACQPVTIVLCHSDVTAGNIMVHGQSVGLIDLDDVHLDMPAVDLSQAWLAIDEFGHSGLGRARFSQARAAAWVAAFEDGYGQMLPRGPEFWLPHVRNVVMYLLNLSRRRVGVRLARLATELRYRRLLDELQATLSDVQRGRTSWRQDS